MGFFESLIAAFSGLFGQPVKPSAPARWPSAPARHPVAVTPKASPSPPVAATQSNFDRVFNTFASYITRLRGQGVDIDNYLQRMFKVESSNNPLAKNPNSSALGLAQFIKSTWLAYAPKYIPDFVKGKSQTEILAMRTNPTLTKQVAKGFTLENVKRLANAGARLSYGSIYLAHFAGAGTAVRLLQAKPSTPVVSVLGTAAVAANPFLRGKTAGEVVAWAEDKMKKAA